MKYLFVILFSLVLVSPALAAKTVSGTVPDLPPLQPPPWGDQVQSVQENVTVPNQLPKSPTQDGKTAPTSGSGSAAPEQQTLDAAGNVQAAQDKKSSAWIWWIIIILGLSGLGFWLKKRGSAE